MSQKKFSKLLFLIIVILLIVTIIATIFVCCVGKMNEDVNIETEEGSKGEVQFTVGDSYGAELRLEEESFFDTSMYEETDNSYELSGRWFQKDVEDQSVWLTVTEGSMIYFKVSGATEVDINFIEITQLETPYYAYIIDGAEPVRQKITESRIVLPDKGEHIVTVVIDGLTEREDKWYSEIGIAFRGIESNGEICGVLPKQKRIFFIGDSLTEGIMTLGGDAISDYNSAMHAYPWYTAEMLDAEPYFMGYGSTGIIATGSFNSNSVALDQYSISRPIPQDEYPSCDLIVINTGTNDIGVEPIVFINGYQELLNKIHNRYPEVEVVCMIPFTQLHAQDIKDAVKDYDWCHVVETKDWEFTYSDEAQIHPDAEGSKVIANYLAEYIAEEVQW
ncbi:MAG: hypothetical protein IJZ44_04685 [Lachnospiraceae bacterium]|nr:hypothetical protein [Lachnospiraceae bacterium]